MFSANSSQVSDDKLFVEDVFSTYLYTGNSGTQTITNGIDLAGKGGLIWLKSRSSTGGHPIGSHHLFDTVRGIGAIDYVLRTNLTDAQSGVATIQSVNSDGFTFGGGNPSSGNFNGETYASWTFREAPKFFDIVTYTGNGTSRNIAHNLGSVPGMIIVKRTDAGVASSFWAVYHRSLSNPDTNFLRLNTQDAQANYGGNFISGVSSTNFTVSDSGAINENGGTYVAYVFAHDTTSDGIIQCGSYTGNGSTTGPVVTLGWEPQWLLIKRATGSNDFGWLLFDNMRGMPVGSADAFLSPNFSEPEYSAQLVDPSATGFSPNTTAGDVNANGSTYVYIAIRRGPMRTPTLGTSVFAPVLSTNTGTPKTVTTNFPVDLTIFRPRDISDGGLSFSIDRLRGGSRTNGRWLGTSSTNAESNYANFGVGLDSNVSLIDNLSQQIGYVDLPEVFWNFRRAPGFFDEVCYTGTGVARTLNHNLGVVPELMIVKARSVAGYGWFVYAAPQGATKFGRLDLTNAFATASTVWNDTAPTASVFSLGAAAGVNDVYTYVAYLFASCPGVSKVGSYTGNGSSQTINCGFAAGARFVMIKRTDSTGDWYVWDTARGIVAANDPYLALNSTAAEVTTDDSVDTASSGFVVNQVAATNVNVNAATYIYLAIA